LSLSIRPYTNHPEPISQEAFHQQEQKNRELAYSLYSEDLQKVIELVKQGADVNGYYGFESFFIVGKHLTPLELAYQQNNCEAMAFFIKKGADLSECNNKFFSEPRPIGSDYLLSGLINNKDDSILELLIESGVDLNVKTLDGRSPLDLAIGKNRTKIAELLILKGADLETKNWERFTPLCRTIENNQLDLAKCLILKGANLEAYGNGTPLEMAIRRNLREIIDLLISKGANVDVGIQYENTPLCRAIDENNYELVELLIKAKADLTISHCIHGNLLGATYKEGQHAITKLFIAAGEDIVTHSSRKEPLIFHCIVEGDSEFVEFILESKGIFSKNRHLAEKLPYLKPLLITLSKCNDRVVRILMAEIIYNNLTTYSCNWTTSVDDLPDVPPASFSLDLLELAIQKERARASSDSSGEEKLNYRAAICSYLIGMITPTEKALEEAKLLVETLGSRVDLKNNNKYRLVLSTLCWIFKTMGQEAFPVLKKLMEPFSILERSFKTFHLVQALAHLNENDKLHAFSCTKEDPVVFLRRSLVESLKSKKIGLGLDDIENIEDKLHAILRSRKKFRRIKNILRYLTRLNNRDYWGSNNKDLLRLFSMYAQDIVEDRYREKRYSLENSLHLQIVFGQGDNGQALLEKWRENEEVSAETLIASKDNPLGYTVCCTDEPGDLLATNYDLDDEFFFLSPDISPNHYSLMPSPLLDGKILMVGIRKESNIVAMCFLTILWDEKEGVPVLFQEKSHINQREDNEYCSSLISEMCKRKAQKVGIPLVMLSKKRGAAYPNPIKSLPGRTTFTCKMNSYPKETNVYTVPEACGYNTTKLVITWQPDIQT
jgi:ankyrin repeat protein